MTYAISSLVNSHLSFGLDATDHPQSDLRDDLQAVSLQSDEFARVIGKDPHRADIHSRQNLSADTVLALLAAEADGFIGVGAVFAVVFKKRGAGPRSSHFM